MGSTRTGPNAIMRESSSKSSAELKNGSYPPIWRAMSHRNITVGPWITISLPDRRAISNSSNVVGPVRKYEALAPFG